MITARQADELTDGRTYKHMHPLDNLSVKARMIVKPKIAT